MFQKKLEIQKNINQFLKKDQSRGRVGAATLSYYRHMKILLAYAEWSLHNIMVINQRRREGTNLVKPCSFHLNAGDQAVEGGNNVM